SIRATHSKAATTEAQEYAEIFISNSFSLSLVPPRGDIQKFAQAAEPFTHSNAKSAKTNPNVGAEFKPALIDFELCKRRGAIKSSVRREAAGNSLLSRRSRRHDRSHAQRVPRDNTPHSLGTPPPHQMSLVEPQTLGEQCRPLEGCCP